MVKLKSLCTNYLSENFWLAKSTKDTTNRAYSYLALCIGNITVDRLTFEHCNRYKGWLLKTGRGKNTANMYLRSLSPVIKWAIQSNLIDDNPLKGVSQLKVTRKPIKIYEAWELERMLRYVPNLRWRTILVAARTTGLRRGALLNLNKDNIRNGFVYVEPKRDTKRTWLWEPKDKEIRKVPCVDALAELLEQLDCYYPLLSPRRYENMLRLKTAGMLTEDDRKRPDLNFRRTFVGIQRRAFGRQIGDFHSFRKTYTTMMVEELPEHFVMKLTGHNSLKTMTYYLSSRESYYQTARTAAANGIKKGVHACDRTGKEALVRTP